MEKERIEDIIRLLENYYIILRDMAKDESYPEDFKDDWQSTAERLLKNNETKIEQTMEYLKTLQDKED